ncbi:MAG: haloacid dehalogenase-like hydrolase [Nanoarchaeota archaeon]
MIKVSKQFDHQFQAVLKDLPKQGYAVFDFDNTCIVNDIAEAALAYLCENNLLKKLDGEATFKKYFRLLEEGHTQEAYEFATQLLAGFTISEIKTIVQETVRQEGSKLSKRKLFGIEINRGIKPNKSIAELMGVLHPQYKIWVVSASTKPIIEEALKIFLPDYQIKCIGMESEQEQGRLTDRLIYPTSTFQGKVDNIKKYISKDVPPILGAGDSMNDRYMLEYCKVKVVVDRNNQLTELAKKNGWIILPKEK